MLDNFRNETYNEVVKCSINESQLQHESEIAMVRFLAKVGDLVSEDMDIRICHAVEDFIESIESITGRKNADRLAKYRRANFFSQTDNINLQSIACKIEKSDYNIK